MGAVVGVADIATKTADRAADLGIVEFVVAGSGVRVSRFGMMSKSTDPNAAFCV